MSEAAKETENFPETAGVKILQEVLAKKLWKAKDQEGRSLYETKDRILNSEEIVKIAQKEITGTSVPHAEFNITLPSSIELKEMSQRAVNKYVSFAVKSGLLSKEGALMTSLFTRGSDINVIDSESGGGLNLDLRYDSGIAPKTKEDKPKVSVSIGLIRDRMELYINKAKEAGIELSQKQALEAAIYAVFVHEWSHSLERALSTKYKTIAREIEEIDGGDKDYWTILNLGGNLVYRKAKEASDPTIEGLEDRDASLIHTERFATGFEHDALEFSLRESGISEDKIILIRDLLDLRNQKRLLEIKNFRTKSGLKDLELDTLAMDVRHTLSNNGLAEWYVPNLWRGVGYLHSYTHQELKQMISASMSSLNHEEVKREILSARPD